MTTSKFTESARQTQVAFKSHRIILLDGVELARLMIEHEVGVRTVQTIRIQKVELEPYEEDEIV